MKQSNRPIQINEILKSIDSEYPADMGISLEAYITDLEAKQPERPAEIDTILQTINSDHPVGMGAWLESYVTDLESKQQTKLSVRSTSAREDSTWQYWHAVKRELQRKERAIRKQNNYQ